jgi:hypothetical protein
MAVARGMTIDELRAEQKRLFEEGKDIPKGPSAMKMRLYTILVRARELVWNTSLFFSNALRCILRKPRLEYVHEELPPNFAEILDKLLRVHAHEIFVDGYFNGDPHPGTSTPLPPLTLFHLFIIVNKRRSRKKRRKKKNLKF